MIGGEWVAPKGQEFTSINPRTGDSFFLFHTSQSIDIENAVNQAVSAYQDYRSLDGHQVAIFLRAIADEIEALGDILLETGDMESGLGIPRLTGERGRTCGQIRAFAEIAESGQWTQPSIDTAIPDRQPLAKPDIRRMMKPIGPVAVFGASNFPFAFGTLGGDTASALAAGNPVIVKGHPSHPATSELFAKAVELAIEKTGMPKGVFSLLQGVGNDLGAELVMHPAIKAVGFTGSYRGGKALMDMAASRVEPIPVYAEMGSVNPVFIGKNTLMTKKTELAEGLAGSVCLGTGQFCTSPGLVITLKDDEFTNKLTEAFLSIPNGTMLNKGIAEAYYSGVKRLANTAGVTWLNDNPGHTSSMTPSNAVFSTDAKTFQANPSLSEEVFGPVTLLVNCSDESEILDVAAHLEGQLTATVHTTDEDEWATRLTDILEQKVGRVIFNGYPTGVEVCPSMQHGGPFPASSYGWATSVGADAIVRFGRFVAYQNVPDSLLPDALKNGNPLKLFRRVNGSITQDAV